MPVEPLVIDTNTDESWTRLVPKLDAIIDAAGGDNISKQAMAKFRVAERVAQSERHASAAKLTYIWTSGTWIQGSHAFEQRSDGAAITDAPSLTAWRPDVEIPLRSSEHLNGIVIRPSLVYGRSGSITAMIFEQAARKKAFNWPGDRATTLSTIHVDDLAQCYTLAIERAPSVAGLVMDCTNNSQESLDLLLVRLAQLEGISTDQIVYKKPSNAFEEALITSRPLRPSVARALLGWQPLKAGLIDGLPQYYAAYKAHASAAAK